MAPKSIGGLLQEWMVLYFVILKCVLLLVVIPTAFIANRFAWLASWALRRVDEWQPVLPDVFVVEEK